MWKCLQKLFPLSLSKFSFFFWRKSEMESYFKNLFPKKSKIWDSFLSFFDDLGIHILLVWITIPFSSPSLTHFPFLSFSLFFHTHSLSHTHAHTHIHNYTLTHTHTQARTYTNTHTRTHKHTSTNTQAQTHKHKHTSTNTQAQTHGRSYTQAHKQA